MADHPAPKSARRKAEIRADAETLMRAHKTTPDARAAKIAFWDWDLASGAMVWSEDMAGIFGVGRAGKGFDAWAAWRAAVHPDDLPAAEKCVALAVRDGTPLAINYRIVLPDGSVRWIEADGDIVRGREDKPARLVGSCRDVTRRKQSEEELESYRRQLEASLAERTSELDVALRQLERTAYELTENIPVGTYTFVKRPGQRLPKFEFMSKRFVELCGVDREALAADSRNGMATVHPDDAEEWARRNLEAFDADLPFRGEVRFFLKGGYRWIAVESIPRKLPDGTVIWEGVLIDITERKAVEADLEAARKREHELEEKMRAALEKKLKTSLNAAAVAHEINQPLSRILLRARMNLERSSGGSDEMLRALIDDAESVVSTIDKMKVLLRNVKSVQEDVDLDQVMASAMDQLKAAVRGSRAGVSLRAPRSACIVRGDAVQLKMVFVNLIQNALDAVAARGKKRKEIAVGILARGNAATVVVGDSGPGWPGGTLDEMLLNTSKPGGSGIGLYVVKTAIENHAGKISIGRSPLGGAEFRITLPRERQRKPPAEKSAGNKEDVSVRI